MGTFLMILFVIVCLLLIVVVLLQKGRGGGLGSAFGGGAGSSAFGTRTGDVFTWVTIILTALFLLLAIFSTLAVSPDAGQVSTPVFSPGSWPQQEKGDEIKVNMNVGTKSATIRFTTDGTEPTEKSLKYGRSAVLVNPGHTLKAKAFRAGWEPSKTLTVTYEPLQPQPAPADATTDQATSAPASPEAK